MSYAAAGRRREAASPAPPPASAGPFSPVSSPPEVHPSRQAFIILSDFPNNPEFTTKFWESAKQVVQKTHPNTKVLMDLRNPGHPILHLPDGNSPLEIGVSLIRDGVKVDGKTYNLKELNCNSYTNCHSIRVQGFLKRNGQTTQELQDELSKHLNKPPVNDPNRGDICKINKFNINEMTGEINAVILSIRKKEGDNTSESFLPPRHSTRYIQEEFDDRVVDIHIEYC